MDGKPLSSEEATQKMLEDFSAVNAAIDQMQAVINGLPPELVSSEQAKDFRDMIFCMRLGVQNYAESNRALQAGARFAATIMAASALEATLLARCFTYRKEIVALPKWKTLKGSYKANFGNFVRSLDLGKALEIAKELGWFRSVGVPHMLKDAVASRLTVEQTELFLAAFAGQEDVGSACIKEFHKHRNMVHPAVCFKEGRMPTTQSCQSATLLFLVAFSALAERKS